ncbi:hypothetical protein [Cohnella silvisoli]|uniref:DUF1059 domain-containing protein n=1 Tax=Cohnella silvisoli TaxID=2873699 RepID=A0ABV1KV58_9BACL|nr:hypothetical protein [Cohnella silvisoli]MCD9023123.1 hypothetical protein [Cohnella silvisoli]
MKELACNCGHVVKDENPHAVEARMWHHAIHDHSDMLKSMSEDQIVGWLTETHKTLGLQA